MEDLIFIGIILLFFMASWGFILICDRLRR
ncbi:MAG: hypothetical protein H6Q42_1849 [Deltaproteobacteria bacterium]|nr:hypothetical protein [Deltaproteobacteria bacterium]